MKKTIKSKKLEVHLENKLSIKISCLLVVFLRIVFGDNSNKFLNMDMQKPKQTRSWRLLI